MKNRLKILCGLLLVTVLLCSACSNGIEALSVDKVKANTLFFRKDGTVQSIIVEDFEKPYYNKEDLESYVDESITLYNSVYGKDSVKKQSLKVGNNTARLNMIYSSAEHYSKFTGIQTALVSSQEAKLKENIPEHFQDVSGENNISRDEALSSEKCRVIIVNERTNVRVDTKILYYSNAILLNDREVQVKKNGTSVIVCK